MAHVGQQYPLAFRRDLLQNASQYRFGFAERYDVFAKDGHSVIPRYTGMPKPFPSGHPVYANSPLITWTWAPFTSSGMVIVLDCCVLKPRTPVIDQYTRGRITVDGIIRYEVFEGFPNANTASQMLPSLTGLVFSIDTMSTVGLQSPSFFTVFASRWP